MPTQGANPTKQRCNELVILKLESAANEILQLRSANESLRADLSFDHSELLFLKLQLRALEAEAASVSGTLNNKREDEGGDERNLLDGFERWKLDWRDVDARLRERRRKYGGLVAVVDSTTGARMDEGKGASVENSCAGSSRTVGIDASKVTVRDQGRTERGATVLDGSVVSLGGDDGQGKVKEHERSERSVSTQTEIVPSTEGQERPVSAGGAEKIRGQLSPWAQLWEGLDGLAGIYDH